ncbi:hypothetical protein NDU88_002616 [Pleurodeles waltl]|uniref:Uncharacterized protein n=1 Tax=Pleurodeles waltl TaxID=8319 RepID=A0AAV7VDC1_PLEWA|nr:hypothetical protein NDU88_002616 [Pleurodeles waltl]
MRVVTAPAVPAAYSACSLPLRARRPRSSEDATPPLLSGLIAWGESRVSCLASRSYGVPGHDSVSPLL